MRSRRWRAAAVVALCAQSVVGDNCGTYSCPVGFTGVNQASSVDCGGTCTTAICCTDIGCAVDTASVTALLAANNAQLPGGVAPTAASLSACDGVPEGDCALQCVLGYSSATAPAIRCVSSNNWQVTSSCTVLSCPTPYPCTTAQGVPEIECGVDVSACDTYFESVTRPCTAADGIQCRLGYTGSVTLSCTSTGAWSVAGTCSEMVCPDFTVPTGVTSGGAGGCPISGSQVLASAAQLKPVTKATCSLQCLPGYNTAGSGLLRCSTTSTTSVQLTTSLVCTEQTCNAFALPVGVVPGDDSAACAVVGNVVPAGTLKVITVPTCSVKCAAGYTNSPSTLTPTRSPTSPTGSPTKSPTTSAPSRSPTGPTRSPTTSPTKAPTAPTMSPTKYPTAPPTQTPSMAPTSSPTMMNFLYCAYPTVVTGLSCTPNTCTGGLSVSNIVDSTGASVATVGTHPSVTTPTTIRSGAAVTIGTVSANYWMVPTAGYNCNVTTGVAVCSADGANQATVEGVSCGPKQCPTVESLTTSSFWTQQNLHPLSTQADVSSCGDVPSSGSSGGCTVSCADGYAAAGSCTTRLQCNDTDPTSADPATGGSWSVYPLCLPITCSLASFDAAANNVVMPTSVTQCDQINEAGTPCSLTCADGYANGASGTGPQLTCIQTGCGQGTWSVTRHCVARCTPGSSVGLPSNTGATCTSTGCSATSVKLTTGHSSVAFASCVAYPSTTSTPTGWFLHPNAQTRSCDPPPGTSAADASRDCSVSKCCLISCGLFASCPTGFTAKNPGASFACDGPLVSDCTVSACCDEKQCLPANAPTITGASINCNSATAHGSDCLVTPETGYICTGTVGCTAQSSETGTYLTTTTSGTLCTPAPCPVHSSNPPSCNCDPGYAGTARWSGSQWLHTCVAQQCARTSISNSRDFSSPESLSGTTDQTIAIVCLPGYTASASTTTCRGATLTFDTVTCNAQTCTPTSFPNSDRSTADAVTGTTGSVVQVQCLDGFIGSGTGCPNSCSVSCDGTVFTRVSCSAASCPVNSGPSGTCDCVAGYATASGNAPTWSQAQGEWTHVCLATCGTYTCSQSSFSLLQPPASFRCPTTSASSCTDALCCRGAVITPTSGLVTSESGGTATFTVTLVSQPSSTVTVTFTSNKRSEAQLSASTLVFNPATWSVPQTVTVTGVDDFVDDGDQVYLIESATSVSADTNYHGLKFDDVSGTNTDNDLHGVTVNPTSGLVTTEAGDKDTFAVVLDSQPTADVTIPVSIPASHASEGTLSPTGSLTFTAVNWNIPQTLTVTGVPDNVDDGNVAYVIDVGPASSSDPKYNQIPVSDVTVTNMDDDARGVIVTPTSGLRTTEAGGSAQFTVRLNSQPTATVTIGVRSTNEAEGRASITALFFSAADWNTLQTVVVTGVQDSVDDDDVGYTIVLDPATSADGNYNNFDPADVAVTNADDDTRGARVSPTSGLVTSEAGNTAFFSVQLETEPVADVTFTLSTDESEGTLDPKTLTFTQLTWSAAQTITVTGADDMVADGDVPYTVLGTAASSDPKYNGYTMPVVSITNQDNDEAGITVEPSAGLVTTEAGGTANFTMRLTSEPIAGVTVSLTTDSTEGVLNPTLVSFNSGDWMVPQTVLVTGVQDFVDDGDVVYFVDTAPAISADSAYSGLDAANVAVTNRDDDTRGITVTPTSGLTTTEMGGAATFTLVLDSEPTADVTIAVVSTDETEGTVAPASLTFTAANWRTPQTATVTGVQDTLQDGAVPYTVATGAAVSNDLLYNGLNAADVLVTNLDDDTPGITVSPTAGLVVSEFGTTATFTVVLNSRPAASVDVPMTTDATEGKLSPTTVRFTGSDWDSPKVVTVTGVDDVVQDGNVTFLVETQPVLSADPNYNGLNPLDVSVVNLDNDKAGIIVSPTTGLQTSEAGQSDTFTVVLQSAPVAAVSIRFSTDTTEGMTDPLIVSFDDTNWNSVQTVTVNGVDDDVADGSIQYNVSTNPASSADTNYQGLNAADVTVTNADNDTVGFNVTPTSGLRTTESGLTDFFTMRLSSRPSADVTVGIQTGDSTEGVVSPTTLMFTTLGWNVLQTVTVTGVGDDVDDGNVTYNVITSAASSIDAQYNGVDPPDVSVTNADDDTAAITVSPTTGLTTTEWGGVAEFTLVLNTQPIADVSVGLASGDPSEGTISPTSVVFSAANWMSPQTVTVTGVDDSVDDGNITYTVSTNPAQSNDPRYDGYNPANVMLNNTDDDTAAIKVSPLSGLVTTEAGGTAFFTLVLATEPTSPLTIGVSTNDSSEGSVSPQAITFTPGNWVVLQTVTVTGVDDVIDDGDIPYNVTFAAAVSSDSNYRGMMPPPIPASNTDDDTPDILVSPITGLRTSEDGTTAEFTVVLASQPDAAVTVGVSSGDLTEGRVGAANLIFTTTGWNTPQTVAVTGVDDFVADGDIPFTVTTRPATSSDPKYSGLNAADVSVTNADNDVAGIDVTPTTGLITGEEGDTAFFTVVLNSEPTASVSIGISSGDTTEGTVLPDSLVFTSGNWNVRKTVTVTGVSDNVMDGDQTYTVATSAAISADGKYDGINAADVTVVNRDNDVAGVSITPSSGLVTSESGGIAEVTVVLNSEPTADVNIPVVSSDKTEGSVSTSMLVFIPANFRTAQTVTVTGVDDDVFDGNVDYSVLIGPISSNDNTYNGMDPLDPSVTNADNDTAAVRITPTSGLVTAESGTTATFSVRLESRPTGDVTVGLRSSDLTEGTVNPTQLVFNTESWRAEQTVTVTGVDDFVDDGDVSYTINTLPTLSVDGQYNGLNPPDVQVTNTDDETRGITIMPAGVLSVDELGIATNFTIRLDSEPTAGVLITFGTSDSSEGRVIPSSVLFTSANWNTPANVSVVGMPDGVSDGNVQFSVNSMSTMSKDPLYSELAVPTITVTNRDVLNECAVAAVASICRAAGQRCRDPDMSPQRLNDWLCECVGSATGTSRGAPANCVHSGECSTNSNTCTVAGQACFDPTASLSGDWQCTCVAPAVGAPTAGRPAICTIDECAGNGAICAARDQTCIDLNTSPSSLDDWECRCREPLVGSAAGGLAVCTLKGECVANAETCTAAGQTCDDPNTQVSGDWECTCIAPAVGRATTGTATCILDECSLYGDVCTAAGQQCNDPNTDATVIGDWTCDCVGSQAQGSASAMPAACVLDECASQSATCTGAGQLCHDPDQRPGSVGDWECQCYPPSVGSRVAARAVCTYAGECVANAHICTAAGQTCYDPDQTVTGDWMCECVPPHDRTGNVGAPAVCVLNECKEMAEVCTEMGQLCEDPNTDPASLNDWMCVCVPPSSGSAEGGTASCVFQGECVQSAGVCTAVGQTCRDPDVTVPNDWQCLCVGQQTGSATGAPAICILDECLTMGDVCADVGQVCQDPDVRPTSKGDWTCNCAPPARGIARAREANCIFQGECVAQSATCTRRGQTCVDPDTTKVGDWMCVCLTPSTGSSTAGPADCVFDECGTNSHVCTSVGQQCTDPNTDPRSVGDWLCNCVGGQSTGSAQGKAASCILDECRAAGTVCAARGQQCVDADTDPASTGNWECRCPPPATGSAVGQTATCAFSGECASTAQACLTFGQTCVDPDPTQNGNWECRCVSPQVGSAIGGPASCMLDECIENGEVCRNRGQVCNDPNTDPGSAGDWTCSCVGSATGSATARAAVCTHFGECAARAATCTAAGQSCSDADQSRAGDWECICPEPYAGRATAGIAECVFNECNVYGSVCSAAGQKCRDPYPHPASQRDWTCTCVGSAATGSAVAMPADCRLDECGINGVTCTSVGQRCVDTDTDPSSVGDWQCVCVAPATGSARGTRATCVHAGECVANAQQCSTAGQACIDRDTNRAGDWRCECLSPLEGTAVGKPAACILDECVGMGGNDECRRAGQTCVDPNTNPSSLGDWTCNCVPPATGSATGRFASCEWEGECETRAGVCTAAGQTCNDPDESRSDDWQCVCVPPQVGTRTGAAVQRCSLDECLVYDRVCSSAGQTCDDPNTDAQSTGDWRCSCVAPAVGSATAAAAVCAFQGECVANSGVCTSVGQACADPSTSTSDDWECVCVAPQTGRAVRRPAACTLNECRHNGYVCTGAAQRCTDPNTSPASTGDWMCECIGSASGRAVAAAASCNYPGACSSGGQVCVANGQACFIPDGAPAGEFQCVCVPPQTGAQAMGPASCSIDECALYGSTCTAAGQMCVDPDMNPLATGDWECRCVSPATGSAVAAAAVCAFSGECVARAGTCVAAGQTCRDPDLTKSNDWQCVCVAPSIGTATTQPATCELDECTVNGAICTAVGQECLDPTPVAASVGDWVCQCVGSNARGTARGRPAACVLDECLTAGRVCAAAGQLCTDPNTDPGSLGDWRCRCAGGATGSATRAVAQCNMFGECVANSAVCTNAGQACTDPDSTRAGDWQCVCVSPAEGTPATATSAVCTMDECEMYEDTCEDVNQECNDPNTSPTSLGDWRCVCQAPLSGAAVAGVATCSFVGECVSNAVTCTSAGQTCRDSDLTKTGDWECVCVPPQTGAPATAAAADCVLDECIVHGNVCTVRGQTCTDPNTSPASPGDWLCTCVAPATGSVSGAAAQCVYSGECTVNAPVCEEVGQTCIDPTSRSGDWQCVCVPPATGRSTLSTAVCVLDECAANEHVCLTVGQTCVDPTPVPGSVGDWRCQCVAPAAGSAVRMAATCTWSGECVEQASVCTAAGQTCVDPTPNAGDWECVCVAPRTGRATARVSSCTLDECADNGVTCTAAGQSCTDRQPADTSLGDWACDCPLPSTGSAVASAATCVYDECATNGPVCESAGQACEDPDVTKSGDWRCKCVAPLTGFQTGSTAQCSLNECNSQGTICSAVGQVCEDPDMTAESTGDWTCNCIGSASGRASARTAVCTYAAECVANARTCTAAGQACRDPDSTRKGDWECECVPPLRGSATGTVATCVLDECVTTGIECYTLGQTCHDPNTDPQVLGDWYCSCVAPATGQATARAAACVLDECQREGRVCLSFGQTCRDASTDPASTGDWTCSCAGSARGAAVGSVAACISEGECATNGLTCAAAGQSCTDPSPLTAGDWRCDCVPPATGDSVTRGPASCTYDECVRSGALCLSAGQTCRDPNKSPTSTGDWTCSCGGSATGVATAAQAVCTHTGECATRAPTCTAAGQACVDPSGSQTDDWECVCVAPAVGRSRTGPASCVLDECLAFGSVCTMAGQQCTDANTNPLSTGDWRCTCSGAAGVGSARAKAATCLLDECLTAGLVCTRAGQECVDLNTSPESTGDWECRCAGSSAGQQRGGPAQCTSTGECVANANTCRLAGQACSDPDPTKTGDWQCMCVSPQQGRAQGQTATCVLDECMTSWSVCAAAGQTCRDPNTSPDSTGDWVCDCVPPATGTATAGAASCAFAGECAQNSAVCTSNGQTCEDPDFTRTGDWRCVCVEPEMGGSATGGPARCTLDECSVAGAACLSNGQACVDPNRDPASTGDWRCECVAPSQGSAVGRAAVCTFFGECAGGPGASCAAVGQACNDPTEGTDAADWECVCVPPAVGLATAKAAECTLDECTVYGTVCTSVQQVCVDPNTAASSTGDWRCDCVGLQGSARGRAATCLSDECASARSVCAVQGQACSDPNPSPSAMGDWECTCVGSATGRATARSAVCTPTDECALGNNAAICSQAGQACIDPDPQTVGDWRCMCVDPETGSQLQGPAACSVDECLSARSVCVLAGQTCRDPDTSASRLNDWLCECGGSSQGSAVGRAALCVYTGECAQNAQTCVAASQECFDPTDASGNWQCRCVSPAVGTFRQRAPAACTLDECNLHGQVCYSAGQTCRDPNTDAASIGDWICSCEGSGVGSARARPAMCAFTGECATVSTICTAAGQTCRDPDLTVAGDWQCVCVTPRSGSATGVPAICTAAGECTEYGSVCTNNGQSCVDPDLTRIGDWQCHCVAPLRGTAIGRTATCTSPPTLTPVPAGTPSVTVSMLVSGRSAAQLRQQQSAFVTTAQQALGLSPASPRRWTIALQSQLQRTGYSEAGVVGAVVRAANLDASSRTTLTAADVAVSQWTWRAGQGRAAAGLQTATADAEFEFVGGSDADRAAWQEQISRQENALTQDPALQALAGSISFSNTAPQVTSVPTLTDLAFQSTTDGSVANLRIQQASGTAAALQSSMQQQAASSLSTFNAAGFPVTQTVVGTSDCTSLTCGVGQTCSDSGGPDGSFTCLCIGSSGVGVNRPAACTGQGTVSPTRSPTRADTPAPPPTPGSPTRSPSTNGTTATSSDDDDDLLGMPRALGIIVIVVIALLVIAVPILLLRARGGQSQMQEQAPMGPLSDQSLSGLKAADEDTAQKPPPTPEAGEPARPPGLPHKEEPSQIATSPLGGRDPEGAPMNTPLKVQSQSPQTDTRLNTLPQHYESPQQQQWAGGGDTSPSAFQQGSQQHPDMSPPVEVESPGMHPSLGGGGVAPQSVDTPQPASGRGAGGALGLSPYSHMGSGRGRGYAADDIAATSQQQFSPLTLAGATTASPGSVRNTSGWV